MHAKESSEEFVRARDANGPQLPSFAQESLWFIHQQEPDIVAYNTAYLFRLTGDLNQEALRCSLQYLVARHDSLRTNFAMSAGSPIAIVRPPQDFELSILTVTGGETEVRELARTTARVPFDLAADLLLRARLFQTSQQESFLVLIVHHACWDDGSRDLLLKELCVAYDSFASGANPQLSELPLQYTDFANWQRRHTTEQRMQRHVDYWRTELEGAPNAPLLLTDHPRPARQTYNGRRHSLRLTPELAAGLEQFNRRERVTTYMTMMAVLAVLLHRQTGQQDVVIGCPITTRTRVELESVIGMFINTLAIRCRFDADPTFAEILRSVRAKSIEAMQHSELPFQQLVRMLHPHRSLSHTPLYQVVLSTDDTHFKQLLFGGLEIEQCEFDPQITSFDLTLFLDLRAHPVIIFDFNTDLFDHTSIERMASHFQTLLGDCIKSPDKRVSRLQIAGEQERSQLLAWGQNRKDYPLRCVHQIFEEQVAKNANASALLCDSDSLTYGELNRRANRLAHHLLSEGVQTSGRVALLLARSVNLVVSMLAVLKAGAVYVPIDPEFPQARIDFIGENCDVRVTLTNNKNVRRAPASSQKAIDLDTFDFGTESSSNPSVSIAPDAPAYCLHTSGSTGKPKGVEILHAGITRLVFAQDYADFGPKEVFLHLSTMMFDPSTLEIWGPLLQGGQCALFTGSRQDAEQIGAAIRQYGVTSIWLTTSLFNVIIEESPEALAPLRQILVGGEALSVPHIRKGLRALPRTQLINGYGPTENTTFTTCYRIPRELPDSLSSIPIGSPIANSECYIFDAFQNLCPIGVPGELYAGGDGVALRYVNSPEMTAERFVTLELNGETKRLYKTGDICRWLPDGNIEFLGRQDGQVKVHGARIELGEIESTLAAHPLISAVAVNVVGTGDNKRLAAYIVSRAYLTPRQLRHYLRQQLPDYMVPVHYIFLVGLPLTSSGKVDRRALPPVAETAAPGERGAPVDYAVRQKLAEIWKSLLGVSSAREDQDFFDLGGHSLLAVKMMAHVDRALGVSLPVAALFEHSTLEELSKLVAAKLSSGSSRRAGAPSKRLLWIGGGLFIRYVKTALQPEADSLPVWLEPERWKSFPKPYRLADIARAYAETIMTRYPSGPYMVGGHCYDGVLAFETAQELRALGAEVDLVVVIDADTPGSRSGLPLSQKITARMQRELFHLRTLSRTPVSEWVAYLRGRFDTLSANRRRRRWEGEQGTSIDALSSAESARVLHLAMVKYKPDPYDGRFMFFQAEDRPKGWYWDLAFEWRPLVGDHGEFHEIPGNHMTMLESPNVEVLGNLLRQAVLQNASCRASADLIAAQQ